MYRLLFIPDCAAFDAATPLRWRLLARDGAPLREGQGTLASVPHADTTVAVVPHVRLATIETPLPAVSAERRDRLLQFAIEDQLTRDPATVHAVVLGPAIGARGGEGQRYVVAALDRDWFGAALAWLETAGPVSLAIAEAALLPASADEWRIAIEGTSGVAVRGDGLVYPFDAADLATPPFALKLALNEAAAAGIVPTRITILTALPASVESGGIDLARWRAVLADNEATRGVALACMAPVAAFDPARWRAVNLRRAAFAVASALTGWARALRPVLALAVGLIVLQLGFTAVDAWRLAQQRSALEAEMRALFVANFPDAAAIVDPALQLRRNLEAMRRERGLADDPSRALLARAAELVGSLAAKVERVQWENRRLRVEFAPLTPDEFRTATQRGAVAHATMQGDAAKAAWLLTEGASP